jgi:hypothetical protein
MSAIASVVSDAFVQSVAHVALAACVALAVGCGGPPAPAAPSPAVPTLPAARGGQDLVGRTFPALTFDARIGAQGEPAPQGAPDDGPSSGAGPPPRATLYRWWTDGCRFCATSLPAVELLRVQFAERGLRVVGVYHPKPPRAVDLETVRRTARDLGYAGALAVDADWSELGRLYLSTGTRHSTSASFLVDADGVIRFVHPGPEFHPSDDPAAARQDADYQSLVRAVEALLGDGG